ncbi:MAG: F0F1 ATP synthase subunit epsilon [Mycoplasmoidaceae bacterium]|nr:F0F1 ATP synthase subunit epsilon [Mycoplasmoidaceae bacterium]
MAKEFRLQISTPKKVCINADVISVTLPTSTGYVGILPNHSKIVGAIIPNFIYITYPDGQKQKALINYGMYSFKENKLVILSDLFESKNDLKSNELQAIEKRMLEESKELELPDRATHTLNSYLKTVIEKVENEK